MPILIRFAARVKLKDSALGASTRHIAGHGCLSPEPYAFESGFAVQTLIVAQIKYQQQPNGDGHSGSVGPNDAPWINWGPYLWTNGDFGRADGLRWCNQNAPPSQCATLPRDVR